MVFLALAWDASLSSSTFVWLVHGLLSIEQQQETESRENKNQEKTKAATMSPSSFFFTLFTILSSAVLSSAQTGPQAAMIPACVVRFRSNDPVQVNLGCLLTIEPRKPVIPQRSLPSIARTQTSTATAFANKES
jgi:hypothetical protein